MTRLWSVISCLVCVLAALGPAGLARGLSVQEMARLEGQGETTIWGLGFVMGLPGTGDPANTLPLARQLAKLLERGGNPIPNIEELYKGRNVAMVMVTCTIPRTGARRGDKLDVQVRSWHSAKSLEGGSLFITPLQGPLPGQGVYAFAEGPIIFEGASVTGGRVLRGATVSADITMEVISGEGTVTLIVEPGYAGWPTAKLIAGAINSDRQGLDETLGEIARAVDERTVRVAIPPAELPDPGNFIASILEIRLDPSLLSLPARVIVNERKGTIVVSGDVEISASVISHRDLVVTTITPVREPTVDAPLIERTRWATVGTAKTERDTARLQELLEALKQLDVPVQDQIAILSQLHRNGALHAEFVVE